MRRPIAFFAAAFLAFGLLLPTLSRAATNMACWQTGEDFTCHYFSDNNDVMIAEAGDVTQRPGGYLVEFGPLLEGNYTFDQVCDPQSILDDGTQREFDLWEDWNTTQNQVGQQTFDCVSPSVVINATSTTVVDSSTATAAAITSYQSFQELKFAWLVLGAAFVLFLWVVFRRSANPR